MLLEHFTMSGPSPNFNMAAMGWSCRLFVLYLIHLSSAELSPRSGYVTLTGFHVRKARGDRYVTIRYAASSKPTVTWQYDYTKVVENERNREFLENDYSRDSENGSALVLIPYEAYTYRRPKIRVVLHVPDFRMIVEFDRETPDTRYQINYKPIYFDIGSHDILNFNKGEQLQFTVSLRSEDLQDYDVPPDNLYGMIRSFDYDVFPPERIQRNSLTEQDLIDRQDAPFGQNTEYSPFILSNSLVTVNATVKTRACRLNTSADNIAGKASLSLILRPVESSESFIDYIHFERIFYVKEEGQPAPFRENSAVLLKPSMFNSDITIRNLSPEVSYTAHGYPKPELTLKRGCGGHVDLIPGRDLNVGMYTTTTTFKFPPVNRSVTETYTLTTKSGTFVLSEFVTFERKN